MKKADDSGGRFRFFSIFAAEYEKLIMKKLFKKYVIDALSHMALGLFCSLILGVILGQLAKIEALSFLGFIAETLSASSPLVGACIGMAIAYGMKCPLLVNISSAIVGALGYRFGGPVGAYLAVIVGVELGSLVSKRTPVDIIVTPLVTIVAGGLFAKWCCSPINDMMLQLGMLINHATTLNPFFMGIAVAVLVGCALTLPISSVAICVMLNLDGRCRDGWLLRTDDRLRRNQFQGQRHKRPYLAGRRNVDVADRQYSQEAAYMDRSDYRLGRAGPGLDHAAGHDQQRYRRRYGNMWTGGADSGICHYGRHDGQCRSHGRDHRTVLHSAGRNSPCYRHGHEACRLDQARRHEDRVSPLFGRMPRAFR